MKYNNNVKYANFKGVGLFGGDAKILAQKLALQRQKFGQQAQAAKQALGNKLSGVKNSLANKGIKPQLGQQGALSGGSASQRALAITGGNSSAFQRNLAARQTLANQAQTAQAAKQARVTAQAKPKYNLAISDADTKQIRQNLQKQKVKNTVNQRVNQRVQTNAINARDDVSNRALGKQANPRTFVNNYQGSSLRQNPNQQIATTNANNTLKNNSAANTYNPQPFRSASDFLKDRQNQLQRYGGFKKTSKYTINF